MSARADRLAALMAERELDCLLVTEALNVRWLSGFTGSNGACLV
jgi:Xaa-Pro aminopeptidase